MFSDAFLFHWLEISCAEQQPVCSTLKSSCRWKCEGRHRLQGLLSWIHWSTIIPFTTLDTAHILMFSWFIPKQTYVTVGGLGRSHLHSKSQESLPNLQRTQRFFAVARQMNTFRRMDSDSQSRSERTEVDFLCFKFKKHIEICRNSYVNPLDNSWLVDRVAFCYFACKPTGYSCTSFFRMSHECHSKLMWLPWLSLMWPDLLHLRLQILRTPFMFNQLSRGPAMLLPCLGIDQAEAWAQCCKCQCPKNLSRICIAKYDTVSPLAIHVSSCLIDLLFKSMSQCDKSGSMQGHFHFS